MSQTPRPEGIVVADEAGSGSDEAELASNPMSQPALDPSRDSLGTPPIEFVGITKRFGSVLACDAVDLTLKKGKIHGILGENGAGKSTLMKMLIGIVHPDSGQIRIDGSTSSIGDPIDAASKGIGMVHQDLSVVNALTVWENVSLGDQSPLNPSGVRNEIGDLSRHYGLEIDPDAVVGSLGAGLRQRVEIIKCLRRRPRVVILDEPTGVLTPLEAEQLFAGLRHVVETEGLSIALVSHNLAEIGDVTDVVTVMQRGRVVSHQETLLSSASELARDMVGRDVALRVNVRSSPAPDLPSEEKPDGIDRSGVPGLQVLGLSSVTREGRLLLHQLDFSVWPGEIVGIAGVEGNGQRALVDLLSSLLGIKNGSVKVAGSAVTIGKPGAMAKAGVAVIPEDRLDSGLVPTMSVAENLFLSDLGLVSRRGVISQRAMTQRARELIEKFAIDCPGPDVAVSTLSGGNQQRVVLARELSHDPKVLIASQPTRGLDVGAIEYLTTQLRDAAANGVAVVLISSELDELVELSDRILVMSNGRTIGEMTRGSVDMERLGLLMGGVAS